MATQDENDEGDDYNSLQISNTNINNNNDNIIQTVITRILI